MRTYPLRLFTSLLALGAVVGALSAATGAALAGPGGASGAAVPRLTLRLREVTLADAAQAMTQASGIRIDPTHALPVRAGERASFDWQDVTLDRALRELCGRFRCSCFELSQEYRLLPLGPTRKSPAAFTKDGVTVTLTGIARSEHRGGPLKAVPPDAGHQPAPAFQRSEVTLSLLVDVGEAHADWDVRVTKVIARDNLGNNLAEQFSWGTLGKTFPSQRFGLTRLPLASPAARTLVSVEGHVELSRRAAGPPLVLPYPKPGDAEQLRDRGASITVSQARPAEAVPAAAHGAAHPDLPPALLSYPAFDAEQGPTLLMQVHRPVEPDGSDLSEFFPSPRAIGRSGRSYPARGGGGGARSANGWVTSYSSMSFPEAAEPLERLVWDFRGKAPGTVRVPFRLTNIPIPAVESLPVQREWTPAPPTFPSPRLRASPPEPYFREGGAALSSEVRLLGLPAPAGVLRLGLATRDGKGWSPLRWCEVPVNESGGARLAGLAPGRYRVLRQYVRGSEVHQDRGWDPTANPAGRWLGSDVEVEVPAGGDRSLPPLELSAASLPTPAAAPRAVGAAVPADLRWEPVSVSQSLGRSTAWEGFSRLEFQERGEVSLSMRLPAGARQVPADIPFLRSASAMDDLGTVLTAEIEPPSYSGGTDGELHRTLRLSAAHPRARELRWVEGELYSYRRQRKVRIEMPFPQPGQTLLVRDGADLLVTVADDSPPPARLRARPDGPENIPVEGRSAEPRVRFRVCYRGMVVQSSRNGLEGISPIAYGKSGAQYLPRGGGGMGTQVEGWVLSALRASYPDAREPLQKLVWELDVWEAPTPLGSFRIEHVALPLARPAPPAGPLAPPPAGLAGDRAAGGLVLPLRPAPGTQLPAQVLVGLCRRQGNAWGAPRWWECPVQDGHVRVSGVRPGRYRLLLRVRAQPSAAITPAELAIAAGKETRLPVATLTKK